MLYLDIQSTRATAIRKVKFEMVPARALEAGMVEIETVRIVAQVVHPIERDTFTVHDNLLHAVIGNDMEVVLSISRMDIECNLERLPLLHIFHDREGGFLCLPVPGNHNVLTDDIAHAHQDSKYDQEQA